MHEGVESGVYPAGERAPLRSSLAPAILTLISCSSENPLDGTRTRKGSRSLAGNRVKRERFLMSAPATDPPHARRGLHHEHGDVPPDKPGARPALGVGRPRRRAEADSRGVRVDGWGEVV
jgi:hypothetical protein